MQTTSLGFKKPDLTDNADLTVFVGQNMDTLDGLLSNKMSCLILGNNDWVPLVHYRTGGTVSYSASDRGVLFSGVSTWVKVRTRIPIDPESTYFVRAKVTKKSGNGTFYIGADSLDNNFNSINTDTASSYNYFGASGIAITAGSSQYFEATISGYNATTTGTPTKFDPEAKYFDIVLIANYNGTGSPLETVIEWLEVYKAPNTAYVGPNKVWHAGNINPAKGGMNISVGTTAPSGPVTNDIWIDTN